MEQEKMKRARERDDETEIRSFENINNAKRRDLYGINFIKEKKDGEEKGSKTWDSHLALGVFDFPWLKDGVISKTEDYFLDFEDKFSSSLEHQDVSFNAAGIDFSEAYSYCETPEASMAKIPQAKLVENVWQPFESDGGLEMELAEDLDCIWSSLLNKPLSQEQHGGSV